MSSIGTATLFDQLVDQLRAQSVYEWTRGTPLKWDLGAELVRGLNGR